MRLTNWYTHPADNRYHVFEFRDAQLAQEFERDLRAASIDFEQAPVEAGNGEAQPLFQFGVHRKAFKQALKVNHLLHGRHRRPFIAHLGLRWLMLLVTASMVVLAIVGWMRS
ncbi:MAG: hypothetical protein L7S63_00080 [Flavobacteriales bacterium]|nr:hypothetical protein [Flavobacteriales bacterium]